MEQKSNKLLKVSGIIMIIGGAISIILGVLAVIGVGALALLLGDEANTSLLMLSSVLVLFSGIIQLIAGIMGVKNAANPEKAGTCIVFGVIIIVLSVIGNILNVSGGNDFNAASMGIGLVLPIIYIIGAVQNKKMA